MLTIEAQLRSEQPDAYNFGSVKGVSRQVLTIVVRLRIEQSGAYN